MPNRPCRVVVANRVALTAPPATSVAKAASLMRQANVGSILVVEGGRLRGIFTERDALFRVIAEGRDPRETRIDQAMTRDPQTILPDKPFGHALHMMHEGGYRHVPVVDANGEPIGMVSARDALRGEVQAFEAELAKREHIGEILG